MIQYHSSSIRQHAQVCDLMLRLDNLEKNIKDKSGCNSSCHTGSSPTAYLTKADVGLGNVDNTSDLDKPVSSATQTALAAKLSVSEKGTPNGVASLDANGHISTSYLPSNVNVLGKVTTPQLIVTPVSEVKSTTLFGMNEPKIKNPNWPSVQFSPQIGIYTEYADAQTSVVFQNSNGRAGYINTNKATVVYASTSDYRLKTDFRPLDNATEQVKLLKPGSFEFIADPGKRHIGFLAHEVAAICPQAVAGEKDAVTNDGEILPQGLDQSHLIPLLVKSIHELAARVDQLENKNTVN